jgi:Leucine-rich repeat (LRR) protein
MEEDALIRNLVQTAESGAKSLSLRYQSLTNLPPEIGQLTNLRSLDISGNSISELPQEIENLVKLTSLDFTSNKLKRVPPEIGLLKQLQTLHLYGNQLTTLPSEIGQLTELKEIRLHWNELESLPPEIGALTKLKIMFLPTNHLRELPQQIYQLQALAELNVERNRLSELHPSVCRLANLSRLVLNQNQISVLPKDIGQLSSLTELSVENNHLTVLPPELGMLKGLKKLRLSGNNITRLPPEIGELRQLAELDLGRFGAGNDISELPLEIGRLKRLVELYVEDNSIAALPPSVGLLGSLTELSLENNRLTTLPAEFGNLTHLQKLNLKNNQLTNIPPEIGKLSRLRELDLRDNQLTELPKEIAQLSSLETLLLSRNPLTALPPELVNLTNLTEMRIQDDNLVALPLAANVKRWDVFVSHASEDKDAVAIPLVAALRRAGLRVWLDKHTLRIGDSIREQIDEGLSESRFGVVIFSENFLNKEWPKRELNGLMALEDEGRKVILPVWHEISRKRVAQFSPILADRLAADTRDGFGAIASQIAQVVFASDSSNLASLWPSLTRRLVQLIEVENSIDRLCNLLVHHPLVAATALGAHPAYNEEGCYVDYLTHSGGWTPDLRVGIVMNTVRLTIYSYLVFASVHTHFFDGDGVPAIELANLILQLKSAHQAAAETSDNTLTERQGVSEWGFQGALNQPSVIVTGRRDEVTDVDSRRLRDLNRELAKDGISIRTYDWLIEACKAVELASRW